MSIEEKERKNELTVCGCVACGCVDANECKKKEKKEKKENYSKWVHADANALRANANECKEKRRKKKKTYLEWEHADGNVLCADGLVCRWCCMQMGCMGTWMVVAAEMVGADECKKKTKK